MKKRIREQRSRQSPVRRITVVLDGEHYPLPMGRTVRKRWCGWQLIVSGTWSQFPCYHGRCAFYFSLTQDGQYYGLRRGRAGPILAVAVVQGEPGREEIAAAMMRAVRRNGGPFVESYWFFGDSFDSQLLWRLYWQD